MDDRYNLQRFVKEQTRDYSAAYTELSQGKKRTHWMWWIFPQIEGLGMTSTSRRYSIKSLDEARAYLQHPYLGKNLRELCNILLRLDNDNASEIFGYPDDLKLCSSMTLFSEADPTDEVYRKVLDKFYNGKKDEKTLKILREQR
jgi:Uncharacterized conserved protein